MYIPEQIAEILEKLEQAGFEAYIVGGCVRDGLRGEISPASQSRRQLPACGGNSGESEPVHDYDITTAAEPEQIERVFSECRVIETGLKHGTVTVLFKGMTAEITTFRVDGEYDDCRHPNTVSFTRNLADDLARRDFTMNAVAYSPKRGIIDLYGGKSDITNHIIRAVGDAEKRFSEDALRILRALRFSSVLGFGIEEKTRLALLPQKDNLKRVSGERVFSELKLLLCGENVGRVLTDYREVLAVVLPDIRPMFDFEQHSVYHDSTLYIHTVRAVAAAKPYAELRLAMLFHDTGKPCCVTTDENGECHYRGHAAKSAEIADRALRELKCGGVMRERVCNIVKYHDMPIDLSEKTVRRRLSRLGRELFRDVMEAHIADDSAKAEFVLPRTETARQAIEIAEKILSEQPCLSLKSLAANGRDLSAIVPPSPKMGKILNTLLNEVIDGSLENEKTALLARAKELASR